MTCDITQIIIFRKNVVFYYPNRYLWIIAVDSNSHFAK